jgi:hypothetical protein
VPLQIRLAILGVTGDSKGSDAGKGRFLERSLSENDYLQEFLDACCELHPLAGSVICGTRMSNG